MAKEEDRGNYFQQPRQAMRQAIERGLDWLGSKMTHQDVGVLRGQFPPAQRRHQGEGWFISEALPAQIHALAAYILREAGQEPGKVVQKIRSY